MGGAGGRLTQKRQPKRQENSYDSFEDENDQDYRASTTNSSKSRNKKDFKNFTVTVGNEKRDDYYESEGKFTRKETVVRILRFDTKEFCNRSL